LGESFAAMISLFLRVCKSFGMSIMYVVLLLYGGEWCGLEAGGHDTTHYKKATELQAKYDFPCWFLDLYWIFSSV